MKNKINEALIEKLKSAKNLVFFTGAGMSAESGIPTFRGTDGIWNKFKPEELANFNAFLKNPKLVWEWYQYRKDIIHKSAPNNGHIAIKELEKYYSVSVITQNVDNLHYRAGSSEIYELHGNIEKNYCISCNKRYDFIDFPESTDSPRCECGGLIRPDIVWFGENLPQDQYSSAEKVIEEADIFFSIGTSGIVYPAAYLALNANKLKKFLVEINPVDTELTHIFDLTIRNSSASALENILTTVKSFK